MNHVEYSAEVQPKQTNGETSTTNQQKRANQTPNTNRRHARLITNVTNEQELQQDQPQLLQQPQQHEQPPQQSKQQETDCDESQVKKSHKVSTCEPSDDSTRRFKRLREIRRNLRSKYDDNISNETKEGESEDSKDISDTTIKHVPTPQTTNADIVQLYNQTANSVKVRDKKHRSRTLEGQQLRAVDNQIYGCSSSKTHHRSESHKTRSHHHSFRRSSDDIQDKKLQLRRHLNFADHDSNEAWFEIEKEHWSNLLENGWRPTEGTSGVNIVSFADTGKNYLYYAIKHLLLNLMSFYI